MYANNLEKSKVTVVKGLGQFISPTCVAVGNHYYTSNHILIATGGIPTVSNIPGAELGITSDGFFALKRQPMSPLIIGAGYIATELVGLLHGLGSRVSMLLRKDKLLRTFDRTIYETMMEQMSLSGIKIMKNIALKKLFQNEDNLLGFEQENGELSEGYDTIIWAIGRHTNVFSLQLEKANLESNLQGFIETDEYQNTAVNGIYAVGDITPRTPLTPVAIAAGRCLSDRLFNHQSNAKLDYRNIPTVVFSHPPVGMVGLTEMEAKEQFGPSEIKIYQRQFINMHYAISEYKLPSIVKLITQKPDEKILGCHFIGDAADEILQGFAVAIKAGATKKDFDNTVAIHPTAAEEFVTLR